MCKRPLWQLLLQPELTQDMGMNQTGQDLNTNNLLEAKLLKFFAAALFPVAKRHT